MRASNLNQRGLSMTRWAARLSVTAPKLAPGGRITRAVWAEPLQAETDTAKRRETVILMLGRSSSHRGSAVAERTQPTRRPLASGPLPTHPAPRLRQEREQCSCARPRIRGATRSAERSWPPFPGPRPHFLLHFHREQAAAPRSLQPVGAGM